MTRLIILSMTVSFALHAQAQDRKLKSISYARFNELTSPEKLDQRFIYYTEKIQSFTDWQSRSADEVEFLNLFPGYDEPDVKVIKNGLASIQKEKITVFNTRSKIVLDKPAAHIDLKRLIEIDVISQLTPQMQHKSVSANEIMPLVAGRTNVSNFSFCNDKGVYILRPARERDLRHTQRPDRRWCDDPNRSICVQSCFKFGVLHRGLVSAANTRRDSERKIDHGISVESEMRYYVSEAEMGRRGSLTSLTGLNTPIRGIIEQSMFYWNQIMQFGKVLAVFQEHPTDSNKTIVTSLFVIGIKSRTYNENVIISELIRGRAIGLNDQTGIMAGVPTFTQEIAKEIGKILEQ